MTAPAAIGRYRVVAELGRGGMGVVYRAHDPVVDRDVALKTIRSADEPTAEAAEHLRVRFLREARAAGRLSHPNIVSVLDAGTDEQSGVSFLAMELVEGRDLEALLRSGLRPSPAQAAALVADVADALGHAHDRGIVHRDVKPANILRDAAGRVKVTDFGIAGIAESSLTRTGQVMGSPAYMSPEQISGQHVDARSDLFSLGVVLYELLAGARPFAGRDVSTLTYQIVHTEPPPLATLDPSIPSGFQAVVTRALAKRPDERYPRAQDLAADLRRLAEGAEPLAVDTAGAMQTVSDGPDRTLTAGTLVSEGEPRSRLRLVWLALGLLAAAACALWLLGSPRAAPQPPAAAPRVAPGAPATAVPARPAAPRPTATAPADRPREQPPQAGPQRDRKDDEHRRKGPKPRKGNGQGHHGERRRPA